MSKHTPGPWVVFDGHFPGIDGDDGKFSVLIYGEELEEGGIRGRTSEEIAANARLIAAAPDLLEALDSLKSAVVEGWYSNGEWWQEGIDLASAAIAKAKGGAE